jgi:hypothetical protein
MAMAMLRQRILRFVHGIEKSSNPEKTRSVHSNGHFAFFHVLGIRSKTGVNALGSIFKLRKILKNKKRTWLLVVLSRC